MAVEPIRISDVDDPRVADYRNVRDSDLLRREAFMAESEVVLRVLIERSPMVMRSVLVTESKLDKLRPLLCQLPAGVPLYMAEQALMDGVIGFHIHRGVLAAGLRGPVPTAEAWLANQAEDEMPRTLVVLEALTNHDNVGGVFRNAAAFGAHGVLIDPATCDPLYRKAIRVSVGASLFLPYARYDSVATVVAALQADGFTCMALTPNAPARDIRSYRGSGRPHRVALLLGTEGAGLSDSALQAADQRVRIDIDSGFDSLNVAATAAVALHELRTETGT